MYMHNVCVCNVYKYMYIYISANDTSGNKLISAKYLFANVKIFVVS